MCKKSALRDVALTIDRVVNSVFSFGRHEIETKSTRDNGTKTDTKFSQKKKCGADVFVTLVRVECIAFVRHFITKGSRQVEN